jgi:hypothetical protein
MGLKRRVPMSTATHPADRRAWRDRVDDPQTRVALVTAVCLLVEAVVAKNVLDVELGFISQLAPFWVFVAFLVTGLRDRTSELAFTVAVVLTTIAVLVLYAL